MQTDKLTNAYLLIQSRVATLFKELGLDESPEVVLAVLNKEAEGFELDYVFPNQGDHQGTALVGYDIVARSQNEG